MKSKIAIVRGKFLNRYEMQFFEPLIDKYDITAFGSLTSFHDTFAFPIRKLASPMDLPEFPGKMPLLNRIFTDAHVLFGLESQLQGFDLVHSAETYYYYTKQCLEAKKQGRVKKVIATVLENIPFNNEGIHGRKALKKYAREELDHIIALTERTKVALLLEGADEKKITVISHFIDTERFTPKKDIQPDRMSLCILFCGRLERYKGVYEILYAAKLLLQDADLAGYHLEFHFVGDGTEKERMLSLEKTLGIDLQVFHTTVSYDAMPAMYQNADIYVAPSKSTGRWQEQYNTTLLEAQASGLPIVTTYSGGIPENVGEAAVLIQPDDILSLYKALKLFIQSPSQRKEYGKKARERAETVHNKKIGAKKISQIYEIVL